MRRILLLIASMIALGAVMRAQPIPPCDPILNPCPDWSVFDLAQCACPTSSCPNVPWQHYSSIGSGDFYEDTVWGSCVYGKPFKSSLNFYYRICNGVLELCSSIPYSLSDQGGSKACDNYCPTDYRRDLGYALNVLYGLGVISMRSCPDIFAVKWHICTRCAPGGCSSSISRCYMWINVCSEGINSCEACPPNGFNGGGFKLKFELIGVYSDGPCSPPTAGCTPGCQGLYDIVKCFDALPSP